MGTRTVAWGMHWYIAWLLVLLNLQEELLCEGAIFM